MPPIIICQPDLDYFIWQLKAQMYNFHCNGIEQDAIVLLGFRGNVNPNARAFAKKTRARVIFYEDKRPGPIVYFPNIVPEMMKQFFSENKLEKFLYIGDDCLFTGIPVLPDAGKVYLAGNDVRAYVSCKYIKVRNETVFQKMCNIVGIDPVIVEANDRNCGGAQYFFNNVPGPDYWEKVQADSEMLLKLLVEYNARAEKRIQAWTAGMWAMLWNLWKFGIDTEVTKQLDFSWPSTPIEKLNTFNFFHNSGVMEDRRHVLFFKGDYRFSDPVSLAHVDPKYCSRWYADQVVNGIKFFKQR